MDSKVTNILYYCTFIGWIVAVICGDKSGSSLNHKNQGFVLGILGLICGVIGNAFWWIPVIGMIVGIVLNLVNIILLICAIVGICYAAKDEDKLIPYVCAIRVFNE